MYRIVADRLRAKRAEIEAIIAKMMIKYDAEVAAKASMARQNYIMQKIDRLRDQLAAIKDEQIKNEVIEQEKERNAAKAVVGNLKKSIFAYGAISKVTQKSRRAYKRVKRIQSHQKKAARKHKKEIKKMWVSLKKASAHKRRVSAQRVKAVVSKGDDDEADDDEDEDEMKKSTRKIKTRRAKKQAKKSVSKVVTDDDDDDEDDIFDRKVCFWRSFFISGLSAHNPPPCTHVSLTQDDNAYMRQLHRHAPAKYSHVRAAKKARARLAKILAAHKRFMLKHPSVAKANVDDNEEEDDEVDAKDTAVTKATAQYVKAHSHPSTSEINERFEALLRKSDKFIETNAEVDEPAVEYMERMQNSHEDGLNQQGDAVRINMEMFRFFSVFRFCLLVPSFHRFARFAAFCVHAALRCLCFSGNFRRRVARCQFSASRGARAERRDRRSCCCQGALNHGCV